MNAPIRVAAPCDKLRYHIAPPALLLVRDSAGRTAEPPGSVGDAPESTSDWCVVHQRLVALASERAAHEHELCRWLRAAERVAVHCHTGHGSLVEYAERLIGLRPRQTEERLRVARALESLPELDQALRSGVLCWSAVRELTRVATPDTVHGWLGWAQGKPSRQIEQAIAARRPGDRPESRPDPLLVKHRLRFEVRPETMALVRDLQARIQADLGAPVDDDTFLHELARRALGGSDSRDDGRASYQVAITKCPECGLASVDSAGQRHITDGTFEAVVACDCQELGSVAPRSEESSPVGGNDHGVAAFAVNATANLECVSPHVGALPSGPSAGTTRRRATQSIPPAIRRQVLRRDRHRCVVDGCQSHQFLDVHHLVPRAEGGRHDLDRLACLCFAHHRAVHAGTLVLTGTVSSGLSFQHADGSRYGTNLTAETVHIAEQAFGALRNLGFPQTQARALLDKAMASRPANCNLTELMHAALRLV